MTENNALPAVTEWIRSRRDVMVDFLTKLARSESPTDVPGAQAETQGTLADAFREMDYEVRHIAGRNTGGHLYVRPRDRVHGRPGQLLLGHCDTVWPLGTLRDMPVEVEDGILRGPGVFDMKGGLTQMVFALGALRDAGLEPPATPVVFINSDEEIGSPESRPWVRILARSVARALVLEPSWGPHGRLKTARKGVGAYTFLLHGKAAHAGLEPEGGVSAIEELSHVIRQLHSLTDLERGVTVNVGVVRGGTRSNVIAAEARAEVDVRVLIREDGERLDRTIRAIRPVTPGVTVEVRGGMRAAPLERTPRNRRLWHAAVDAAHTMGLDLDEVTAGGGSDGNTTSLYTATLDGLGPVGGGAHARHEFVEIDGLVERTALLAHLLMAPVDVGDEV